MRVNEILEGYRRTVVIVRSTLVWGARCTEASGQASHDKWSHFESVAGCPKIAMLIYGNEFN